MGYCYHGNIFKNGHGKNWENEVLAIGMEGISYYVVCQHTSSSSNNLVAVSAPESIFLGSGSTGS